MLSLRVDCSLDLLVQFLDRKFGGVAKQFGVRAASHSERTRWSNSSMRSCIAGDAGLFTGKAVQSDSRRVQLVDHFASQFCVPIGRQIEAGQHRLPRSACRGRFARRKALQFGVVLRELFVEPPNLFLQVARSPLLFLGLFDRLFGCDQKHGDVGIAETGLVRLKSSKQPVDVGAESLCSNEAIRSASCDCSSSQFVALGDRRAGGL